MSPQPLHADYPPALSDEQAQFLLDNLKDWSIANGLAVRPAPTFVASSLDPAGVLANTAPVTLFPSLFPKNCYEEGLAIQKSYNELYSAIARDEEWLKEIVEELIGVDEFVAKLWKVHLKVKEEGPVQDITLGLFRSDYMVHLDPEDTNAKPKIKQVEFNTIASSFGGLSSRVSGLHKHLLSIEAYPADVSPAITQDALPENKSVASLAAGLAAAHKAYGQSRSTKPLCVLFVVQDPERNVFDQRLLEYSLLSESGVRSYRVPFSSVLDATKLDSQRNLIYRPKHAPGKEHEVSTVYFRAGYSPDDYPSETEWDARLHIERSHAIKCPSVLLHLAGCKKVQQVLATPHSPHLARFLSNDSTVARVKETFAPIYPLDKSDAGLEARKLALNANAAQRYVLKPQREGGGNNIYRKNIPPFLATLPESSWPAYILMEMIEPPAANNVIIRNGEVRKGGVIGELGVYGVCLWRHGDGAADRGQILENWEAGYLLRTKGNESEEGGVAAGFGAVDSICLVDV
ncbi:glutathione synthetase large chain [Phyllosticta citribraziliensis]|uniref:Glutathione synthetase n=1 Tax=Phyllosticta citribraziliensis TaxID=989973 RepID=A0ABR1L7T8_9PEZI